MRPTRLTKTSIVAAVGLALGAAMLALPVPARAADDDVPIDTKILRGILEGIGLQREEKIINYQERPPLVIPPNKDLPPPEELGAVPNNPAWPKDPDVTRAKLEKKMERESLRQFVREDGRQSPAAVADRDNAGRIARHRAATRHGRG